MKVDINKSESGLEFAFIELDGRLDAQQSDSIETKLMELIGQGYVNMIIDMKNEATDLLIYNFPEASVTYYLDTRWVSADTQAGIPTFLAPPGPNPAPQALAEYLANLLRPYQRLWFVPVEGDGWDDARQVETWLTRHADRISRTDFHWIRTDLYLTPAEIERSMQVQVVSFVGGITLRGFRIFNTIPEGQNQVILTEAPLDLSLYWTAGGPTGVPLTVFTQLIDATGFFRGGQDNQPVWDTYQNTDWQPQEQITDKYQISLQPGAPPGVYQVWVGFYDLQTGQRVMVLDDAGAPRADHVVLDVKVIVE